jgi:hypothetical protein
MALVEQSDEQTPAAPSTGTDFIALEEGFTPLSPEAEEITNPNLTGSTGVAKTIRGLESAPTSFDHLLHGSGVEGQAPSWATKLMKNFFGAESVRGTERDTIGGSTKTAVNVDTAEGSEFSRGDAILVKHSGLPWEIRNVLSVAGDVLTIPQELVNAPALGVNLGLNVLYAPEDDNNVFHSVWQYLGNVVGGKVLLGIGERVTSFTISGTAGDLLNVAYEMNGIQVKTDPIDTTTNNKIDFNEGGPEINTEVTAQIWSDPIQLADAIAVALNAAGAANFTCTYDDTTGQFTVTSDGVTFQLLLSTGTNGSGGTDTNVFQQMGFDDSADKTGALTYTSDNPVTKKSSITPVFDNADALVLRNMEVMLSDESGEIACVEAESIEVTGENTVGDKLSLCAPTGKRGTLVTQREFGVTIVGDIEDHAVKRFKNFRENDELVMTMNLGEKDASGNWLPGRVINIHSPTMKIDSLEVQDSDGKIQLSIELSAFVKNGLKEFFINQV